MASDRRRSSYNCPITKVKQWALYSLITKTKLNLALVLPIIVKINTAYIITVKSLTMEMNVHSCCNVFLGRVDPELANV